jgi:biopolymer transport protein ExbB
MNAIIEQILHTWTNGGWVMAALALVAAITYISATRLLVALYHRGLTRLTDADLAGFVREPARAPAKMRELIRYTQDNARSLPEVAGRFREVEAAMIPDYDRRLVFLNIMVVSAPLFGLLGTVLGMLLTFKAIGIGGSSTSEIIARGISEALVATQTGMMVAIPGLLLAHLAKRWRNEYVSVLARLEGVTLRHLRVQFQPPPRLPAPVLARPAALLPSPGSGPKQTVMGSVSEPVLA